MPIILPPGSRWLKSWKAPTFVSFGDKNRQGPADADLAVQALDLEQGWHPDRRRRHR